MTRQTYGFAKAVFEKMSKPSGRISFLLLLLAYGFVTVFTPNLKTLDSNGPKFLTLALLNLGTYIFLFTRKDLKTNPKLFYAFFSNSIGLAYCGLMIVSLLSFFKAINVLESVLHFSKIFTTFSAAYLVSILIISDKRNILYLSIAMTLLLIFDSITVFLDISKYVNGIISNIGEIKSVYSNKNILASSVFVKIPFALWLMVFHRKWLRSLGILGTFLAILATLFLSARAFYLGIFALTFFLIIFLLIRYLQSNDKDFLRLAGIYLILFVISFLIFSTTQKYLYPKTAESRTRSVVARLASISEPSGGNRFEAWKRSWNVFKEEPILGIGLGNWKIATLKEENLTSQDYILFHKAHNDFIEITTETGILGGLFFIALFFLSGWGFLRALLLKDSPESMTFLFLPAFGLFCYSFDAFFNFPQDRPEIQALFALFLGMVVAINSFYKPEREKSSLNNEMRKASLMQRCGILHYIQSVQYSGEESGNNSFRRLFIIVFGLILIVSSYILYLNFNSLKLQRIVKEDNISGNLSHQASLFLTGFPAIPNLNYTGEPIAVQKARYLINEQRFDETITLLKNDRSSPFDGRNQYCIAFAYYSQNNYDSSFVYSNKAYNIKPYFFMNISLLCNVLFQKGIQNQGEDIIEKYLSTIKNNKEAWIFASAFYERSGNIIKASSLIDTAANYFPTDSLVLNQKKAINNKAFRVIYKELYDAASNAYSAEKYHEAARYCSELLTKVPDFNEVRKCRAFSNFFLKEFLKSNQDLNILISTDSSSAYLYNLRGANYIKLGNKDQACKDFKKAAEMGDKEGLSNYSLHCQSGRK